VASTKLSREELLSRVSLYAMLRDRGCEPNGQRCRCPLPDHEDRDPSASYTPADGDRPELWHCFACGVGGTAVDLLVYADGLRLADAFDELGRLAGNQAPEPRPAKPARAQLRPPSALAVRTWADALQEDQRTLDWLAEHRGWSPDTLARFDVGVHPPLRGTCAHSDRRISVPVRNRDGELIGLACYQPDTARRNRDNPKLKATGRRDLTPPPEALSVDADEWLILCEGEPDALCALSYGFPCVAVPGIDKWESDWAARFEGLRVLVIGDCDPQGRAWARNTAGLLVEHAREVRVADVDESRDDGTDLTDWILAQRAAWGGDPAVKQASMDALIGGAQRVGMDQPSSALDLLDVRVASDVPSIATEWLLDGLIPIGSLAALAGRQGLGKSIWTCDLAAQLSVGALGRPAANTFMITYEDSLDATLRPRLQAAGADLSRVHLLDGAHLSGRGPLTLPADVELIGQVIRRFEIKLLIIDPVGAALAGEINSHRDSDVRAALAPLASLAARERVAVLLVMHRRKGYAEALDAVMGSTGFTAAPRSVLIFGADPQAASPEDGLRLLAHAKCNLGQIQQTTRWALESVSMGVDERGEEIQTARIRRVGVSDLTADDLTREMRARRGEPLEDAIAFLQQMLAGGPMRATEVKERARMEGISDRTLKRARAELGVIASNSGFQGAWTMQLPDNEPPESLFTDAPAE